MESFVTLMSTNELMPYREFDREAEPAPFCYGFTRTLSQIMDWFHAGNRVTIDNPIDLTVCGSSALLTDGNHRLLCSSKLNESVVWVRVTYMSYDELNTIFQSNTISKFKTV
jgi:hypothetical protein